MHHRKKAFWDLQDKCEKIDSCCLDHPVYGICCAALAEVENGGQSARAVCVRGQGDCGKSLYLLSFATSLKLLLKNKTYF